MSTETTLKSRLDNIGISSLMAPLRRLIKWYLAPSGLLLLLASGSLLLAFSGWGPSWLFGGAGVALLTLFLTYRFSRQQGLLLRAIENHQHTVSEQLGGGLRRLQNELSLSAHSLSQRIDGLASDLNSVGELQNDVQRTKSAASGLDYRLRTMGDGQRDLGATVASTVARVDALAVHFGDLSAQRQVLADLQSSVAALESVVEQASQRAGEASEQAGNASKQADKASQEAGEATKGVADLVMPEPVSADAVAADAMDTLRSDFALWAASTSNQSFGGVTIVVSPERSGTTWAFDILRSLPGASQTATSFVYQTLGIAGNRYPKDLVAGNRNGEAIELRDGVGAFLPRLRQVAFGEEARDLVAVEKVHPSAFDFDPAALLGSLGRLEKRLGRVQLVLLVRDPVDTYRSFVSYQESAGWRPGVSATSVGQFYASSLSTLQRLRSLHEGCLIATYEDLVADPVGGYTNLAGRLGLKADAAAVSSVLEAAEQWRSQASQSPYFAASRNKPKSKPSQLVVGEGLPSESERDALEAARLLYEDMWVDRIK